MANLVNLLLRRGFQTSARRTAELGPSAVTGGHDGGYKVWRNMTFFVAFPAIALCGLNCYLAHQNEPHERTPFVKYEYLRVRTKRFPWGEGQKSLFHNPHANALPDGYEEVEHH